MNSDGIKLKREKRRVFEKVREVLAMGFLRENQNEKRK